ncbi:MAG TPA: T9SS type A sorting domain-containing protein, partial [Chitinophagaceae bacterium]|nr:T9SS type A sorting domain-containing protein [Chitinophagaceae bacterium]
MLTINAPEKAAFPLLLIVSVFISTNIFAQEGTLDATFGAGGKAVTNIAGTGDIGTSVAIQQDGKIILAGYTTIASNQQVALARYMPDGSLDNSFGDNGKTTAAFDGVGQLFWTTIKLQQDGKIVAIVNAGAFAVMRFKADGTVDSTFGTNGRVITDVSASGDEANALAIQEDGKIVVTGNAGCDIGVCRYKTNGTLDSAFGENGIKVIDFGECEKINAVVIQPDKKIVVAGGSQSGAAASFLAVRLNAGGGVDAGFGTNGRATVAIRTYNEAKGCVLQADGKIVVGGYINSITNAFGIARFKSNGMIDSSFGTNGTATAAFSGASCSPYALAPEPDGKIVFAGYINDGGVLEGVLIRYKTDGTPDSTFGSNGIVLTQNNNGNFIFSAAIQDDAKIVTGGYTYIAVNGNDFAISRYNATAILPVKLVSFKAFPQKSTIVLFWSTAAEINSSRFIIERNSRPGGEFAAIGAISTMGNTNLLQQYSFVDVQPLSGDNYYRLKLVDKDGRFSYSKTVQIVTGNLPHIIAYPNPAVNIVRVGGLTAAAAISLADATGKILQQYKAGSNECAINIQKLANGTYFIRVLQNGKQTTLKLV